MPTWVGQLATFAWVTAVAFFFICWFAAPVLLAYWRAREKQRAAETKRVTDSLKSDTTNAYIFDA